MRTSKDFFRGHVAHGPDTVGRDGRAANPAMAICQADGDVRIAVKEVEGTQLVRLKCLASGVQRAEVGLPRVDGIEVPDAQDVEHVIPQTPHGVGVVRIHHARPALGDIGNGTPVHAQIGGKGRLRLGRSGHGRMHTRHARGRNTRQQIRVRTVDEQSRRPRFERARYAMRQPTCGTLECLLRGVIESCANSRGILIEAGHQLRASPVGHGRDAMDQGLGLDRCRYDQLLSRLQVQSHLHA